MKSRFVLVIIFTVCSLITLGAVLYINNQNNKYLEICNYFKLLLHFDNEKQCVNYLKDNKEAYNEFKEIYDEFKKLNDIDEILNKTQ